MNLKLYLQFTLLIFSTTLAAGQKEFFNSKVLPLLKDKCYKCHSHKAKIKAGLALDSRIGWSVGGDSGPAVIPFKPEESLLVKAIRHVDEDLEMPKKKMADKDIAVFVKWIQDGAYDERVGKSTKPTTDWWSLKLLEKPALPKSEFSNPIDAFVSAKLQEKGLNFSPEADHRTLLRRLHYDLHGLPPTPEEVEKFSVKNDPAEITKMVDSLLNSPRYGERWARHWLDTVHYADSHGCEHDLARPYAWRYRDYVIDRLNKDIPWDRFIREQLAADVFYKDTPELKAALGFLSAGTFEKSRFITAPIAFAYLDRDDMVNQTMSAFNSATVNCARRHDHKFDPFSQKDYYALQAVFAGVSEGDVPFDADPKIASERQMWLNLQEAAERHDEKIVLQQENEKLALEWVGKVNFTDNNWTVLKTLKSSTTDATELHVENDLSIIANGKAPEKDNYTIITELPVNRLATIRLDVLTNKSFAENGPGRAVNGNFHLSEFEVELITSSGGKPLKLNISKAVSDWNQEGWHIDHALDGNPGTAWGIFPKVGMPHHAVFYLSEPMTVQPGSQLKITMKQVHGGSHLIGHFKLSASEIVPESMKEIPQNVISALKKAAETRSKKERLDIASYALKKLSWEKLSKLPKPENIYAVKTDAIKKVHVLKRGNFEKPGKEVQPGAISSIKALDGIFEKTLNSEEPSRRAALANWLASNDNPLTWRSIVNRVWQYHFNRGICDTVNDFGRMGGTPSHPELLDWLAAWFRDDAKGSLKALHRLIVTSKTYRQSSKITAKGKNLDGSNKILWRMNSSRMDAEQYRDTVLKVSGRLHLTMGGPGVKHFIESKGVHETPKLDYDSFDWSKPEAARRSIYRFVWRGIPDPFMEALDFPNLGQLAPKRGQMISPLQSLVLLNNHFVLYHSKHMAQQLESKFSQGHERIRHLVRLIYQREPLVSEIADFGSYAQSHGLAALCRLLFNSNEFLRVE